MIESFRNRLWADYKTGAGIEPALLAQFHPLEEALAAMGVVVWPMIELEADDALASAAHLASKDKKVEKVAIWTPDKDLAQCVRGTRVVQIDGRRKTIRDAAGIREKFGVSPQLIPDLLALVGDAADGYPGIPGIGARTAAQLLNRYGQIENFPSNVLGEQRDLALLFKNLATLRTDAPLFKKVETLRWRGATPAFAAWADRMKAPRLLERCEKAAQRGSAATEDQTTNEHQWTLKAEGIDPCATSAGTQLQDANVDAVYLEVCFGSRLNISTLPRDSRRNFADFSGLGFHETIKSSFRRDAETRA